MRCTAWYHMVTPMPWLVSGDDLRDVWGHLFMMASVRKILTKSCGVKRSEVPSAGR